MQVIAGALAGHHVTPADVEVVTLEDRLKCIVRILGGTSVAGVMEAVALVTKDKGGGLERGDPSGIHKAFAQAGCVEDLQLHIAPGWSPERAQEVVRLTHPQRAELSAACLHEILEASSRLRAAYSAAWAEMLADIDQLDEQQHKNIAEVLAKEPMARFGGELLPLQEGQLRHLWQSWPMHEAERLGEVMADACSAQLLLKQVLAPGAAWAQAELNDLVEVPPQDASRFWAAGAFSMAAHGKHFDPGVRSERLVLDEAKWRQRPEQSEPPVQDLVNISRLVIIFKSMTDLLNAFERLLEELDVVWVDNRFRSPNILGERGIHLGVSQCVGTRNHISQLMLQHEALHVVSLGAGEATLAAIRTALMQRGCAMPGGSLTPCELADVTRIVLRELGCTQGQLVRETERELLQVLAYAAAVCGSGAASLAAVVAAGSNSPNTSQVLQGRPRSRAEAMRLEDMSVAQELVKEMTMQALSAGVALPKLQEALALANADQPENWSGEMEVILPENLEASITALERMCRWRTPDASIELPNF